jgi:tetratricopeptide (TPR) repeat protein
MLQRARHDANHGKPAEAIGGLERVLEARPHLLALELELARLRLRRGDPEGVVNRLGPALRRYGQQIDANLQLDLSEALVEAQIQLGRWQAAEAALEQLRQAGRADSHHLLALARAALARADAARAQEALEQCLQQDPFAAEALQELGQLHSEAGRWPQAVATYTQLLALQPADAAVAGQLQQARAQELREQAEAALAEQQWSQASRLFLGLEALDPELPGLKERLDLVARLAPARLRLTQPGAAELERFSQRLDRLEALLGPL